MDIRKRHNKQIQLKHENMQRKALPEILDSKFELSDRNFESSKCSLRSKRKPSRTRFCSNFDSKFVAGPGGSEGSAKKYRDPEIRLRTAIELQNENKRLRNYLVYMINQSKALQEKTIVYEKTYNRQIKSDKILSLILIFIVFICLLIKIYR